MSQENSKRYDTEAFICASFLEGLNKCNTKEDIIKYVDSIIDGFQHDKNIPKAIGTSRGIYGPASYENNGQYKGFIHPTTTIFSDSVGYGYHIYDRNYLYLFAYNLRKLNLSKNEFILPRIMEFLDSYFGYPKYDDDRKDDYFFSFAFKHAEEFYQQHNIPKREGFDARDQMELFNEFPLSALRGTYSAKCMERASLAQNIMKMCGLNSSIMYGDCESRGKIEGHAWNAIYDKHGNIAIVDFTNTIFIYKDGKYFDKKYYACTTSREEYLAKEGALELSDYYYYDGRMVMEKKNRKYFVGKKIKKQEDTPSMK